MAAERMRLIAFQKSWQFIFSCTGPQKRRRVRYTVYYFSRERCEDLIVRRRALVLSLRNPVGTTD